MYRNIVASGKLPGFSPAKRMAKVVWDKDLAMLADLNTKQCKMEHDSCHNTDSFQHSGQNVFWTAGSGETKIDEVIKNALQSFISEYKDANMNNINKVGTPPKK